MRILKNPPNPPYSYPKAVLNLASYLGQDFQSDAHSSDIPWRRPELKEINLQNFPD
jgi:hypothetical protein